MKHWIPVLVAIAVVGGVSHGQSVTTSNQGKPGTFGPWPVTGSSSTATFPTTPQKCTSSSHKSTSVGVAATTTPATQLASRRYLVLCNSLQNAGTPLVKCRIDAVTPVMAVTNPGDVLGIGDCVMYPISASIIPSCISDTAATNITSFECV